MPQSKSRPKERYTRQRHARAIRRVIAAISPSNSHTQTMSPLFSLLPAELRLQIFRHVLSQRPDTTRPVFIHSISPLFRPGHTHHVQTSIALLSTCRLVYYEAHGIPLRSATHHFRYLGSTSLLYNGDIWLRHVTKQQGAGLYHLHDNLIALRPPNFSRFLLPHLCWKRVTWTICAYLWPSVLQSQNGIGELSAVMSGIVLPASCREVTLELETREDLLGYWEGLLEQAELCKRLALEKADGEKLAFDEKLSLMYTWTGSGQARWGSSGDAMETESMEYRTIRLVWRVRGARREYVSYDELECLQLEGCREVKSVKLLGCLESPI